MLSSLTLELRLALLVEGAHAFAAGPPSRPSYYRHRSRRTAPSAHPCCSAEMHGTLGLAHRDRRVVADRLRGRQSLFASARRARSSLFTTPQSSASCAENGLPVRMTSLARRKPTARGRNWVPPAPGMMPSVISVSAKRAAVAGIGEVAGRARSRSRRRSRAVDRRDHRDRAVQHAPASCARRSRAARSTARWSCRGALSGRRRRRTPCRPRR